MIQTSPFLKSLYVVNAAFYFGSVFPANLKYGRVIVLSLLQDERFRSLLKEKLGEGFGRVAASVEKFSLREEFASNIYDLLKKAEGGKEKKMVEVLRSELLRLSEHSRVIDADLVRALVVLVSGSDLQFQMVPRDLILSAMSGEVGVEVWKDNLRKKRNFFEGDGDGGVEGSE